MSGMFTINPESEVGLRAREIIEGIREEQARAEPDYEAAEQGFVSVSNEVYFEGDSPESEGLDQIVHHGYADVLTHELLRKPTREGILSVGLSAMSTIALSERNASKIADSGLCVALIAFLTHPESPESCKALALTAVTNMALHAVSHNNLKQSNNALLKFALSQLRFLNSEEEVEIDLGLTSASLICRLVGYEESGPGPDAIKSNDLLVQKLYWILDAVISAGPDGTVIGYAWNPANIMYDISVVATSDRNKPLLFRFVTLVTRALEERIDNSRMVRYGIITLSQLIFEPKCRSEFNQNKERILAILRRVIANTANSDSEKETWKSATVLASTLEEKPKQSSAAPKLRSVVGALRARGKQSSSSNLTQGHVMISYQWAAQSIAKVIEEHLRASGIKTWFDLNDMGNNINESMAFAVENATAVVVLFSRQYKESGNCRKEAELADTLMKPMIYVKVDPDYSRAEGWLGLVMGKALWIDASQPELLPQLTKRVAAVTKTTPLPVANPMNVPAPVSSKTSDSNTAKEISEIHTLLKDLVVQFGEMKAEIKTLREELALRKDNQ